MQDPQGEGVTGRGEPATEERDQSSQGVAVPAEGEDRADEAQEQRVHQEAQRRIREGTVLDQHRTQHGPRGQATILTDETQYFPCYAEYEEKCLECELLTQEYAFSQAREERTYSEALQADCQKLAKRLN